MGVTDSAQHYILLQYSYVYSLYSLYVNDKVLIEVINKVIYCSNMVIIFIVIYISYLYTL